MALDNLISISFSEEEITNLNTAIDTIESIMAEKAVNLTPEQRISYARVRYEMEVWVNKVWSYMQTTPALKPQYLDQKEHQNDLAAHIALNPVIDRMQAALQSMLDTNLLLGTDLYNNSLLFYRNVKVAAQSNVPGASAVYEDLRQQFPGPGSAAKKKQTDNQ